MTTACLVTTYNRPQALARSLPQITALGAPVLVVDDGSERDAACRNAMCIGNLQSDNIALIKSWSNRGLACALNIGLSYLLADESIKWISYFQDDVDVHPKTLEILEKFHDQDCLLTGHDAGEHDAASLAEIKGIPIKYKWACRATHLYASAEFWKSMLPIPTRTLGAPRKLAGNRRGYGSNVDWYIVRDSPNSCTNTQKPLICVPGLVRSFLWKAADSCWNNESRAGEEPPLGSYE